MFWTTCFAVFWVVEIGVFSTRCFAVLLPLFVLLVTVAQLNCATSHVACVMGQDENESNQV